MQGYIDLLYNEWDEKSAQLSGKSIVVGGETYKVIIANNGFNTMNCKVSAGKCGLTNLDNGLVELSIDALINTTKAWSIGYSRKELKNN